MSDLFFLSTYLWFQKFPQWIQTNSGIKGRKSTWSVAVTPHPRTRTLNPQPLALCSAELELGEHWPTCLELQISGVWACLIDIWHGPNELDHLLLQNKPHGPIPPSSDEYLHRKGWSWVLEMRQSVDRGPPEGRVKGEGRQTQHSGEMQTWQYQKS